MPPVVRSWLAAGLAVAASAAPAAAQQTIAPPGNAGVQQYLETVPSARGNTAPSGPAGARSHHDPAVPSSVTTRLQQHGEEGRKLEALVAATAPDRHGHGSRRANSSSRTTRPSSASAFRSAADGLTAGSGAGGMGLLLPVLLLGSAVVLGGIALHRWRG